MLTFATVLLSVNMAVAQQHPCDVTLPAPPVPTKGNVVGWCHDMRDDGGALLGSLGFKIVVDGQIRDVGVRTPIGGASPSGLFYFEAPLPLGLSRGDHQVNVIAVTPGEPDNVSTDYALWRIGGPANKPVKPRIGSGG